MGQNIKDYTILWKMLAEFINSLPQEERQARKKEISMFVHDMRQVMGVIFSAEGLLRRNDNVALKEEELLNIIHDANDKAMRMVLDMALSFDSEITLPANRPPQG